MSSAGLRAQPDSGLRPGEPPESLPASSTLTRVVTTTVVTLLVALGLLGAGAGAVVAEPAAPAPRGPSGIAGLINQIADVDQRMADIDASLAIKREAANRALVDLQTSRDQERLSVLAVNGSTSALQRADAQIASAQKSFDTFVRDLYRQGSNQASLAGMFASGDPAAVLDRAGVIAQLTRDQQATIQRLKVSRNEKANRVATASATRKQAARAAEAAAQRKNDAVSAIAQTVAAAKTESATKAQLTAARDAAQQQLDALRGRVPAAAPATVPGATPAAAPAPGAPSPTPGGVAAVIPGRVNAASPIDPLRDAVVSAAQSAFQVAAQAAAKLAVDAAQQVVAQVIASITGSHTDIDGSGGGSGTSSGGSGGGGATSVTPGVTGTAAVEIVVNRALSQLGVPYSWGGGNASGPTKGIRDGGVADSYGDYNKVGFDCSGLMMYAFAGIGISLPHYTGYQYTSGPHVPLSQMQRGDMIFYGPNASQHVAMYLGNNQMVEAPESGSVVKISPLRTSGAMPYVVRLTG
ncbi:NlpC/P60 family protein [Williamsia deligens]|nr:Cell wall-associated hydrolases (invasion-associated proteins) [Williamsia deligens]